MRILKSELFEPGFIESLVRREPVRIQIEDVLFFRADTKYVEIVSRDALLLVQVSIGNLEALYGERFIRIHRNALVNAYHLDGLVRDPDGSVFVTIKDSDHRLRVSRRTVPTVKWFIDKRDEKLAEQQAAPVM